MNLKGKFKNIGKEAIGDLTTVAAIGLAKKGLGLLPSNVAGKDIPPAIKGGVGYLLVKMFLSGSKKGLMQNVANGASLGCLAVAASPILEKIGINGNIENAYVGGSEFIRISRNGVQGKEEPTSQNAYVGSVL
jgi:hypothetical protein